MQTRFPWAQRPLLHASQGLGDGNYASTRCTPPSDAALNFGLTLRPSLPSAGSPARRTMHWWRRAPGGDKAPGLWVHQALMAMRSVSLPCTLLQEGHTESGPTGAGQGQESTIRRTGPWALSARTSPLCTYTRTRPNAPTCTPPARPSPPRVHIHTCAHTVDRLCSSVYAHKHPCEQNPRPFCLCAHAPANTSMCICTHLAPWLPRVRVCTCTHPVSPPCAQRAHPRAPRPRAHQRAHRRVWPRVPLSAAARTHRAHAHAQPIPLGARARAALAGGGGRGGGGGGSRRREKARRRAAGAGPAPTSPRRARHAARRSLQGEPRAGASQGRTPAGQGPPGPELPGPPRAPPRPRPRARCGVQGRAAGGPEGARGRLPDPPVPVRGPGPPRPARRGLPGDPAAGSGRGPGRGL